MVTLFLRDVWPKSDAKSPHITSVQYCGGCSVLQGIASVLWRDSISTCGGYHQYCGGLHQYCGVKFLIFIHLADKGNKKLSTIYNFETKLALEFYRNWQLG